MKIKWLHSDLRRKLIVFRYFSLGRFLGRKADAEVYLALNDPHSFMLVQMLSRLQARYKLKFTVYFIWGALPGVTISPKFHRRWAIKDANLIADQYQLIKINTLPSILQLSTGQQEWQLLANNIENAEQVFLKTWCNEYREYFQASTPTITHQVKNQARLEDKGHYCAATIYFAGDWFIGVDRLCHFEHALCQFDLLSGAACEALFCNEIIQNVTEFNGTKTEPTVNITAKKLEVYLSLRSPYSYLGFVQAIALAHRYQLELAIKPVLPLMMRGASIPIAKQKYIYLDALREAKRLNIEFSGFVDPLGAGVINCYRMFAWAEKQGKGKEYMLACFRAVYVENIDLSVNEEIDNILDKLALDKIQAHVYQAEHDWQQWSDSNQRDLTALEFWGVPCFTLDNQSYWGQDRIPFLEKEIKLNLSIN